MIFVTVGAQMPFDRLVRTVDEWAGRTSRSDVFAQIGPTTFRPRNITAVQFLEPVEFRKKIRSASAIVAHAGMGSILTALELGKPILVMPRRGDLRETRNDHQIATARQLQQQNRIHVAYDEQELCDKLELLGSLSASGSIRACASDELLATVRNFIQSGLIHARSTAGD